MSIVASSRRPEVAVGPSLSVVVRSSGEPDRLRAWLSLATHLCDPLGVEVVVYGPGAGLEDEFRSVAFVGSASGDPGAISLRRVALKRAAGDVVLFTDDGATDLAARLAHLGRLSGSLPDSAPVG